MAIEDLSKRLIQGSFGSASTDRQILDVQIKQLEQLNKIANVKEKKERAPEVFNAPGVRKEVGKENANLVMKGVKV
jgi:NCAIR mutase (PurE)-related protein